MAEALYRKYRPQKFSEVVGQDHITKVLEGAIAQDNIGHAYLFSGTRGLGKTTVARIFAKAIGCTENDLYEIDAASHTGIDNIRELSENVYTLPFDSPYKVYIIDEVHMLSKSAFNAFLKTLEEPPKHVVFILATTETEKLPDTIISRCQTFTFKKPSRKVLADVVTKISTKEGFTLEAAAAELIALLADGSFRDAQSILQKIHASSADKKVSVSEVEEVTGAPKRKLVSDYVEGIIKKDGKKAFAAIQSVEDSGVEMKTFLTLVLDYLRATLLLRHMKSVEKDFIEQYGEDEVADMKELSNLITPEILVAHLEASRDIRFAPIPSLPLELAVIELVKGGEK
ncbi:DNA polymerase III subunit gamma/tau [Candidatus Wolfebacteria bacterium]|nr:DNA polymerase III subunit gamma/tau [Candidatus Wolfebacteria bacterium]